MKTGKSLTEMAQEIERQNNTKRDFVADSRKVFMSHETNNLEVNLTEAGADIQRIEEFPVKKHAHGQLAQTLSIPKQYYDRMPNTLRAANVNHWLKNEPKTRMIRTLDDEVRAVVSSRYRQLDNFDLAQSIIPVLMEQEDMVVESCDITETRMYIKALFPKITGELGLNDAVQAGIAIGNSEVGAGSLYSDPLVYRLVCLNGMISPVGMRRNHVGKNQGNQQEAAELFSDRTRDLDDRAFWAKTQDIVRATVNQASFEQIVNKMKDTKTQELGDPIAVVERTVKKFSLTEGEGSGILEHLVTGGDLSGFGLLNAVTRYSQDIEDYDRATDFERLGGQIIELNPTQWSEIAAPKVSVNLGGVAA